MSHLIVVVVVDEFGKGRADSFILVGNLPSNSINSEKVVLVVALATPPLRVLHFTAVRCRFRSACRQMSSTSSARANAQEYRWSQTMSTTTLSPWTISCTRIGATRSPVVFFPKEHLLSAARLCAASRKSRRPRRAHLLQFYGVFRVRAAAEIRGRRAALSRQPRGKAAGGRPVLRGRRVAPSPQTSSFSSLLYFAQI